MSHENQQPITYIETDYDYDTVNGFLYIPNIPEFFTQELNGLYYDGVSYSWDEIEYRMGVEYVPAIPEPCSVGVVMGTIFTAFVVFKKLTNR
jgi:hypothetical protein